jgi:hypothetical protein
MSLVQPTQPAAVLVAIDIAKLRHDVLIEAPGWKSRKRLIRLQASELLAPAIVRLLGDQRIFAGLSRRLPIRHRYFNLSKQTHDLLRCMLLPSCHPSLRNVNPCSVLTS